MLANPDGRDFDLKPASPLEVASQLKMPLLASFGDEDDFVSVEDVRRLEARLGESAMPSQVDVYAGAGHAFLNRTREAAYRPEASARAWAELIPFLHTHLD
jgi:carboxymethylenebutenolidase